MKKYKYKCAELFVSMFGAEAAEQKRKAAEALSISYRTINRDFTITVAEPAKRIPPMRLQKYAEFLGTSPDNLRNQLNIAA